MVALSFCAVVFLDVSMLVMALPGRLHTSSSLLNSSELAARHNDEINELDKSIRHALDFGWGPEAPQDEAAQTARLEAMYALEEYFYDGFQNSEPAGMADEYDEYHKKYVNMILPAFVKPGLPLDSHPRSSRSFVQKILSGTPGYQNEPRPAIRKKLFLRAYDWMYIMGVNTIPGSLVPELTDDQADWFEMIQGMVFCNFFEQYDTWKRHVEQLQSGDITLINSWRRYMRFIDMFGEEWGRFSRCGEPEQEREGE